LDRIHKFDGIFNFRDFGDYPTQSGRRIRPGKLFRSANFHRATESDLDRLSALDIKLLVDLRYSQERERQPNRWPEAGQTDALLFPSQYEHHAGELAPHEAFIKNDLRRPEDARRYMKASYNARPHDPGFVDMFSKTLKHMAQTGDNLVIHCAAGKDRTGTLGAIILSALGVDQEIILEDYMLTMTAVNIESFLEPAAKMMADRHGRDYSVDALRPMFGVELDYIHSSLDAIGDMERYIADTLNITPSERQDLVDAYSE